MPTVSGNRLLLSSRFFVPTLLFCGLLAFSSCSKSPAQIEKKDLGLGQHYLS